MMNQQTRQQNEANASLTPEDVDAKILQHGEDDK